ncbi:DUF1775 domain-containing protein [Streptomyces sp. NPDC057616]|uniref:DUF1775 domain-containing protein n=1 Tax=Streptomyces sp. NPDC057616 TaxID=3346183 RepID=UPI00369A0FDB
MPIRRPARTGRRIAVVGALCVTAVLALVPPAFAHAEVEADTPRALATDVTLTFVSEAESSSGGFTKLRVVLPEGIAPADVTLDHAPKGWKLTAAGDGYTVAGPALEPGVDAEHSIKVRQLPNAKELAFRTVETYSDGKVSRWIELPDGGPEPEQPAPVLKLKAAAAGAASLSPSPTAASPSPSVAPPTAEASLPRPADAADEEDPGPSAGLIAGGVLAALLVLGGGAWWLTRRRAASTRD